MTPVLQVGFTMLVIALSYAIILAASTAAFVIVDRRYELFPFKGRTEEEEAPDVQEQDDIR